MLPWRNWTPFQAVDNSETGGRRSKTRTSWPSASNASTTWLPRNPDPLTTRDRTIASTDAGRNPHPQHSSLPRLTVPAAVSRSDLLTILKDGAQVPAGGSVASDDVSAHPRGLAGNGLRVLDLGCGLKPYAPLFDGRCVSYVGVDVGLPSSADVLSAGQQLPFHDASFDVVLCTQVLEHDPHPDRTVREAHRVLASEGTLILSTHGVWFKHGKADYWRWTDDGLRKILQPFHIVDIHNCGGQYAALFQILNLYADPLPVGRRFLYLLNNVFGLALDRLLPAENLIVNYVVVAQK